ncbi:MAG: DUF3794 domain-containing protein [Peptococcaceae bacterium]|nr:DUF3794 domain-containing protein [Peptococcaceae bacterium]
MPITQNKKRIRVQHIVGTGTAQADITRNIQLPARARKIVDIHAEIVELDYEIIPNKIIIKGALHKQVYYVEEGDYVVKEFTIMREEFTDFVHIQGARPDMEAMLDGHILFVNTNPANGEFPTDLLYQVAVLAVDVKVIETMALDVVTDAYGEGISVQKAPFSVECLIGAAEKQSTISVEHLLCKPARKIYDMEAVCRDLDYEVLPGRVIVRGTLHKQIYYVDACDDTVQAQCFDNEFSVVLDVPGAKPDMEVYTRCRIDFCEAKLMGPQPCNMVKANAILQVSVKVTELTKMNIVTGVEGALTDRCRIRVEDIIGRKCSQQNVNQTIDVNAPLDVNNMLVKSAKNMTACVRNVSYEKVCNKVIIKGTIHVQVYYVACNCEQELRETSADIPFTTVVNFDCISEDTMIRCRERVEYTDVKLEGCPCETSKIRAVAILEICVCAFQTRDFMVVTNICSNGLCNTQPPQTKPMPEPEPPSDPEEEICPVGGYMYEVKAGDTLAKIATAFQAQVPGITWQQIARFNNIYAPYTLNIGQTLRIPCVAGKG